MKLRHGAILAGAVLAACTTTFFVGANQAADTVRAQHAASEASKPEPDMTVRTITHIKTEQREVPVMPESCSYAVELATAIGKAVSDFSKHNVTLQVVADHLGTAIVLDKTTELNKAKQSLNEYNSAVVAPLQDMNAAEFKMDKAMEECIRDTR